jgi:hypothetical protein
MKHRNPSGLIRLFAFSLLAALPLAGGCGDKPKEDIKPDDRGEEVKPVESERYLPYSIRFDARGNPVVVDEKGEAVVLTEVKPPIKATELVSVQSISVVTYKGSCKQVYNIGGRLYEISLPDAFCKTL